MLAKASSSLFIMLPYSYSQFSLAGWQESQGRGDSPVTPSKKRNGQQLLELAVPGRIDVQEEAHQEVIKIPKGLEVAAW